MTEGSPNVVDLIRAGEINLVINTPFGSRCARRRLRDPARRRSRHGIPCITTMAGASAAVQAISQAGDVTPVALQDIIAARVEPHAAGA